MCFGRSSARCIVRRVLEEHKRSEGNDLWFIAHHVIPPGSAPSDKECCDLVSAKKMLAADVVGEEYIRRIRDARLLGCATVRMQN